MAIDDIIQIKDTVSKEGIIPLDRNQDVMNAQNQVEFLRTQKEMGLSENAVMAKLLQMFVEEPTRFTQEFGKESAEAIREFLGFKTQGDMEEEGYVFEDDSAEIIGQNISFRPPEDSALGTLTTDQSEKFEDPALLERLAIQDNALNSSLPVAEQENVRILTEDEASSMGLSTDKGKTYKMNEDTGKISVKERWLTQEEVKEQGFPYTDGQIYIMDVETGEISRKEPKGIEKILLDIMDWFKYGRQDPENRDLQ
jgi:hypothetical protein